MSHGQPGRGRREKSSPPGHCIGSFVAEGPPMQPPNPSGHRHRSSEPGNRPSPFPSGLKTDNAPAAPSFRAHLASLSTGQARPQILQRHECGDTILPPTRETPVRPERSRGTWRQARHWGHVPRLRSGRTGAERLPPIFHPSPSHSPSPFPHHSHRRHAGLDPASRSPPATEPEEEAGCRSPVRHDGGEAGQSLLPSTPLPSPHRLRLAEQPPQAMFSQQ